MKEETKSVFEVLNAIDCNGHTEKKNDLTYLTWAWAWAELKKVYPNATYTIYKDENNRPYIEDEDFGIMCYTTLTINGQTHEMWLPVMNGANKAMKRKPYSYVVENYRTKEKIEKVVEAATMFDINKTIMRCLVKNIAMFGLGLYIYAGEDLPEAAREAAQQGAAAPASKAPIDASTLSAIQKAVAEVNAAKNKAELQAIWSKYRQFQTIPDFVCAKDNKKEQLIK